MRSRLILLLFVAACGDNLQPTRPDAPIDAGTDPCVTECLAQGPLIPSQFDRCLAACRARP